MILAWAKAKLQRILHLKKWLCKKIQLRSDNLMIRWANLALYCNDSTPVNHKHILFFKLLIINIECHKSWKSLKYQFAWRFKIVDILLSFQKVCRIHFFSWISKHDVMFYSRTLIGCPDHCKFSLTFDPASLNTNCSKFTTQL